ncbi:MAG: antirestriction protein ArdC, partial [Mesorhizobium sp.]
ASKAADWLLAFLPDAGGAVETDQPEIDRRAA